MTGRTAKVCLHSQGCRGPFNRLGGVFMRRDLCGITSSRNAVLTVLVLAAYGCGSGSLKPIPANEAPHEAPTAKNVVTSANPMADKQLELDGQAVRFLNEARLDEEIQNGTILRADSAAGNQALSAIAAEAGTVLGSSVGGSGAAINAERPRPDGSLVMGFPKALLQKSFLFGAVITKMSAIDNDSLGNLKLTDLSPFLVKPTLVTDPATRAVGLVLKGCAQQCTSTSAVVDLITLPVKAVDEAAGMVIVNIAELGKGLSLVNMLDEDGTGTGLKEKSSKASWADFSQNTLLFDVESTMEQIADSTLPDVVVTVRWYLRPEAVAHSQFQARSQTDGIGFFTTSLGATERITRFANSAEGSPSVKYYIKNVPQVYQQDFIAVFSNWNTALQSWAVDLKLAYEVIPAGDPRNELIVTGDIRYNVIEWDLINQATYGGLGPSIAHQLTGETVSGNVLIQGPEIVKIYTRWFDASRNAHDLRERGLMVQADEVLRDAKTEIDAMSAAKRGVAGDRKLTMGQGLAFRIVADMPQLHDDPRIEFDAWPSGVSFATYMTGYWLDTVGHEVGHNLGLRHNFKGNMGGGSQPVARKVSRSIMEYLPITHRYLDFVGEYDAQAMRYGYMGLEPANRKWFCTDEEKAAIDKPNNSAECTTDDANEDAFLYFEHKLNKSIDYLVAPGSTAAPTWTLANLANQVDKASVGLFSYASSAAVSSGSWTNWTLGHAERPTAVPAIKTFVVKRVRDAICNPRIDQAIAQKATQAAKDQATLNVKGLRERVKGVLTRYQLGNGTAITCGS